MQIEIIYKKDEDDWLRYSIYEYPDNIEKIIHNPFDPKITWGFIGDKQIEGKLIDDDWLILLA